jgi:hypothetical protein
MNILWDIVFIQLLSGQMMVYQEKIVPPGSLPVLASEPPDVLLSQRTRPLDVGVDCRCRGDLRPYWDPVKDLPADIAGEIGKPLLLASKRAIMLLEMDWHSAANRALL